MNREERFVLSHYAEGAFDTRRAIEAVSRRTGSLAPQTPENDRQEKAPTPIWRIRIAAAIASVVVVAGAYALLSRPWEARPKADTEAPAYEAKKGREKKVFHFEGTPVGQVVRQLESAYGASLAVSDTIHPDTGQPICLTADLEADSLAQILPLIEEALGVNIRTEDNRHAASH